MTTKANGALSVVIALLIVGTAQLPAVSAQGLSLEQATTIALGENIAVVAAETEVSVAEQAIRVARAQSYPSLSASGSYGTYSGDVMFTRFIPGAPGGANGMDVGPYDTNQLTMVELAQPLYTGGANNAQRRISRLEAEIAEEGLRARRLDTVFSVTSAYYGLILAEKKVEVATESLRRSDAGHSLIESRFKEQEALRAELLGAKSQLAADRLSLKHAENEVLLAQRKLNLLLGRDLDSPVDVSGSLTDASPPTARQSLPSTAGAPVARVPAVRQARLQEQLGEASVDRAQALGRPKLELRGSYAWIDNDLLFEGEYAAATLNLSIPFARDLTTGSAAKAQASAQRDLASRSATHAEREARLELEYAVRQLGEASEAIEVAQSNLEFHREKHRIQESAFREEMLTFSELLDDHVELAEAELTYFESLFNARVAEAHLTRVMGGER